MFHVMNRADLTDEKLMTAIVGAEDLLNSRPITYQSSNVDAKEPLALTKPVFVQPSWRSVCPRICGYKTI